MEVEVEVEEEQGQGQGQGQQEQKQKQEEKKEEEEGWEEEGWEEEGWEEEGWEEEEEEEQQQAQNQDPEAAAAALEEKLRRVTAWLKKIYGDEPVPQYEVNTQTVDILYELAECNEARDRDVSLLIEDMKEKAAEYDAEETLDISPTSLFTEGTDYLNILVESAMILDTKDTSLASFFCAINDMTSELYATESENREMERELSSLRRKLTRALMLEKQLKEDLKKVKELLEVETAKADSQLQNLEFLKKKSEDLKSEIKDAEEKLAATGLDQTLTHGSLMKLSKEVAELQDEIVPLKKELDSYLDLTPVIIFSTLLLYLPSMDFRMKGYCCDGFGGQSYSYPLPPILPSVETGEPRSLTSGAGRRREDDSSLQAYCALEDSCTDMFIIQFLDW
ncbi:HAUS augmin-like complex subunit 1 isoform X2 [Strix aluco]|uniref:HAUS augmin-like complex subunit 1 isoform X2 n=1 Tax=Strix aluco TaxID=111821 RepID=UPI003DA241F3